MSVEFYFVLIVILFGIFGLFVKALKTDAGKKTALVLLSRWFK